MAPKNELKRATWLELFYDVAFVALVAQLTYLVAENHDTLTNFANIFIIGYSIFIAWWATTANRNLQPDETSADKLLVQTQMIGAFFMSITMAATFEGNYIGFFATLGGVRLLQSLVLVRMYIKHPEKRPVTYNILQGFVAASLVWFVSGFIMAPYHFVVAGAALLIDILTPLTRGKGNTVRYLNVYHLQERLGLFLMLVIGESMIVVALSNTASELSINEPAILFSGLGLMVALWWLYFEHNDCHQGVRPKNLFTFIHSHAFLFGSIILLSVGYKLILEFQAETGLIFVLLGASGIALSIGLIRAMLYRFRGRAFIISAMLLVLFILIVYIGLIQGQYLTSVVAVSAFFLLVALLDYRGSFRTIAKTVR